MPQNPEITSLQTTEGEQ